jgi:hypothetical protein
MVSILQIAIGLGYVGSCYASSNHETLTDGAVSNFRYCYTHYQRDVSLSYVIVDAKRTCYGVQIMSLCSYEVRRKSVWKARKSRLQQQPLCRKKSNKCKYRDIIIIMRTKIGTYMRSRRFPCQYAINSLVTSRISANEGSIGIVRKPV